MYKRFINISDLLSKKSHFLFGPRGSGKTTLIKEQLGTQKIGIDLLNSDFFLRLANRPAELEQIISAAGPKGLPIVIDEVQKLPALLDEVHRLIEAYGYKFLLTGSSARKLKHGGANLLAGRAWQANLFPLTSFEITDFNLDRYLSYGGLPAVYLSGYPQDELKAYLQMYLVEEIAAEGLVRDLPLFSRFLQKCSLSSGEILNFSEIASDLGLSPTTVREYYRILEDTLLGFMVEPYQRKPSRKEVAKSKFYLFDIGVTNALKYPQGIQLNNDNIGQALEHFIAQELRAYLNYNNINLPLQFWRTQTQKEVDFVMSDILAIEVKASQSTNFRMAKTLSQFGKEYKIKKLFLVSRDSVERIEENVHFINYKKFLELLWAGGIF